MDLLGLVHFLGAYGVTSDKLIKGFLLRLEGLGSLDYLITGLQHTIGCCSFKIAESLVNYLQVQSFNLHLNMIFSVLQYLDFKMMSLFANLSLVQFNSRFSCFYTFVCVFFLHLHPACTINSKIPLSSQLSNFLTPDFYSSRLVDFLQPLSLWI